MRGFGDIGQAMRLGVGSSIFYKPETFSCAVRTRSDSTKTLRYWNIRYDTSILDWYVFVASVQYLVLSFL